MSAPRSSPRLAVLLGGGIGSGKSAVAAIMGGLGATVISADEVGRQVLEPGGAGFGAVVAAWPQVVVGGEIDRKALAAIVFADGEELERLEEITHPDIARRIADQVAAVAGDVVVETPIPGVVSGDGWIKVFVDAPADVRMRRAVSRGGDPADVGRRMEAQVEREEWVAWADRVIVNDGTRDDLEDRVGHLWRSLR